MSLKQVQITANLPDKNRSKIDLILYRLIFSNSSQMTYDDNSYLYCSRDFNEALWFHNLHASQKCDLVVKVKSGTTAFSSYRPKTRS